jgi:predicted membrane protein
MANLTQRTFAVLLILFGGLLLLANLLNIDSGAIFWPLLLVFVGAFVILRASRQTEGGHSTFKLIGEIDRRGKWQVADEDVTGFVLEYDLDFSAADFSSGQPQLHLFAFVSDVTLRVPEGLGVDIQANCFVVSTNLYGKKEDFIMSGWNYEGAGTGAKRVRIGITSFVSEINLVRV